MTSPHKDDNLWQRIIKSKWFARIVNLPGISWMIARATRVLLRDELETTKPDAAAYYTDSPETEASLPIRIPQSKRGHLDRIVSSVVNDLGYVGAFLALYEQGDVLPIHAFHIRYDLISPDQIEEYEKTVSNMVNQKMSLSDPEIARVYLYNEEHANNLSIRAVKAGEPVIDKELFSLFTPIVPDASRPIFKAIQEQLSIKEVVAVPFTIDYYTTPLDDTHPEKIGEVAPITYTREIVGNLFAVSQEIITPQKINVLRAFGYQAAAAIQNNHYKKQSEITRNLISHLQHTIQSEKQTFDEIVKVIVKDLNYVGSMISISDTQGTLRIKAYRLAKEAYRNNPVDEWQRALSEMSNINVNLQKLDFMDMDLDEPENDKNIGYKVMHDQEIMTTKSMYSLFRPMLPEITREKVEEIQTQMGIKTILAIPLLSYSSAHHGFDQSACIGVFYVASRSRGFTSQEVELLKTVAEQVGHSILQSLAEKRRHASERFARMAFNANASLHRLKNHVAAAKTAITLLEIDEVDEEVETEPDEKASSETNLLVIAKDRIMQAAELLQVLREPFIDAQEKEVTVALSIEAAHRQLRTDLENYKINLTINKSDDIPDIIGFYEMLVQIFRIFIKRAANAIVHLGKRDGEIQVNLEHLSHIDMIRVTITDNGHAIPPQELAEIFDIHQNMEDALVGFGLFWASDYIQGMGGKITVNSTPKQGTVFKIDLPVRQIEVEATEVAVEGQ